jgi:CRISPR-associated protein Csm4
MVDTWQITGGGFHFGKQGLGQEETAFTFPSDSLFAALLGRLADRQGNQAVDAFMAPFQGDDPPFVLSSTFPCAGKVRFYPLPASAPRGVETQGDLRVIDLKKVLFVSEKLFHRIISGGTLTDVYRDATLLQDKSVWVSHSEIPHLPEGLRTEGATLWKVEQRPRVTLGRSAQNSSIFFTGRVVFAEGCGLWFAVQWQDGGASLRTELADLLTDLGDSGLGGERSVGFGACKIVPGEAITWPLAENQLWVSLSRYLPRREETSALLDPRAAYNLVNVGGWLDSNTRRGQRRRAIHMLSEGSVLGPVERRIPGEIVDVRPRYPKDEDPLGHAVYRCGLALTVGYLGGET